MAVRCLMMRIFARHSLCICILASTLLSGCGSDGTVRSAADAERRQFSDIFRLESSVELQQNDTALIVRISGIDVAPDGRIAVSDGSEGHVKIFTPAGTLLTILGRKGKGPGEYQVPKFPRFDEYGRLFVADSDLPRIHAYSPSGELESIIQLDGVASIVGFELLPHGEFLVADQFDDMLLHRVDSAGQHLASYFQRDVTRPPVADQPESWLWYSLLFYDIAIRRDTAFVVVTLSDSLWMIDLRTGTRSARSLSFPGYEPPRHPATTEMGLQGVLAWRRQFYGPAFVAASERALLIPFARGFLNDGDPNLLLAVLGERGWIEIENAPPLLYVGNQLVLALATPGVPDSVVISRYAYRP
jgi:hypothetical protein